MPRLREAEAAERLGNYRLAAELCRTALLASPGDPSLLQSLSHALLRLHDYHGAITEADRALELNAELHLPHVVKAYANFGLRDPTGFRLEAARAHELAPNDVEALTCYGILQLFDHNAAGAIDALTKAMELDPGNYIASRNLVLAFQARNDARSAWLEARRLLRLRPRAVNVVVFLGAFHNRYAWAVGVALLGFMALSLWSRDPFWLIPPGLYSLYALSVGVRSLTAKAWRPGAMRMAYGISLLVITYIVYGAVR